MGNNGCDVGGDEWVMDDDGWGVGNSWWSVVLAGDNGGGVDDDGRGMGNVEWGVACEI